jgi:hypothetical protein
LEPLTAFPQSSWCHLEYVIEVGDPKNLQQLGMDMLNRESTSDRCDPSLEIDQFGQDGTREVPNVTQVEHQLNSRSDCHRIKEAVH